MCRVADRGKCPHTPPPPPRTALDKALGLNTVAQVVLEKVYKSFASRRGEGVTTSAQFSPLVTPTGLPQDAPQPGATRSTTVLRDINLTVADGEFMVLVGPSGCGKSTLLRLIAGLETVTAGNIWVGDRLVNNLPPKARDIAMVFQNYALYPHMRVYDNLAFGLRRTQPNKRGIDQQVRSVAQMLQIEPLLNRLPKELSGGQKQRVALGRAMARNPQVFLMDEPLSNLDAKLRTETRAQIVKLQRQLATTTIYVTHDQTEAMTMGDRIAVVNAGQIQQLASPLELYNEPINRFVAEFIGSPPMNFLSVQVVAPLDLCHPLFRLALPPNWGSTLQPYDGQTLTLGVRPEHLVLADSAPDCIPVQVDLVEALGNDTYLVVSLQNEQSPLQVRINPDQPVRTGDRLWLHPMLEKVHLFDTSTGMSIIPAAHCR